MPVIDTLLWQHRLYYLGLSYRKSGLYNKSITTFQHPIISYRNNEKAGKSYSELGRCYWETGDYYKAIKHYELGASLLSKHGNIKSLLVNQVNTSLVFSELKTHEGYQKSIHHYLKADSLSNYIEGNNYYKYVIKTGLGDSYNRLENLNIPKASTYYKEALSIAYKMNDSSHIYTTYNSLGNLYLTSDPDKAIANLRKAIPYGKKNKWTSYYNETAFGYCYLVKGLYDQSITYQLNAISRISKVDREYLDSKLDLSIFYKAKNKTHLLNTLKQLSVAYYKKSIVHKDKKTLQKSIATFRLADQLIDLIRIESKEFQSKLFWRKQSSEIYGKAIEACYQAGDIEQAFFFMEKNKALLLTEGLKNRQLRQTQELPDSIIDREIDLKKEIYSLNQGTFQDKDSTTKAILEAERNLQNLQDSISKHYQSYTSLKTESPLLSLSELQKSLGTDTAVLMYNISRYDDYSKITPENGYTPVISDCAYGLKTHHPAYGLLITKEDAKFFKLNEANILKKEVQSLITQMKNVFITPAEAENYKTAAFGVYKKLLPTKVLETEIKGKKLRIIPDNYLHYLPFEALFISDNPDASYWVSQNDISYAYSNSFLANIQKTLQNERLSFAGFAPVIFNDTTLLPLQNSPNELQNTQNYFQATNYTQERATKEQFLKSLSQTAIIHLATHADAQDSIAPWIAFRKEKLLQDELRLTTNKAKLIVLSGCNTLLGKQETGEGVMSLARGFFRAGALSVVSSLWSVDDLATSELMTTFYKNLSDGQSKASALREAKLDYLQNHNFPEASPYYWASFVLLGDTTPLTSSSTSYFWWLLTLLPLSIFLAKRYFMNRR